MSAICNKYRDKLYDFVVLLDEKSKDKVIRINPLRSINVHVWFLVSLD